MMVIRCENMEEFMDAIEGCVKRGLTFTSCVGTLRIELLGGY